MASRVGGMRRQRGLTLLDILENGDITPVIFSYLDLGSAVRMTGVDKALRALRLTEAVQEVANAVLGSHRVTFLRMVGSQGGYSGLRRLHLNKGIEEDSHAAICDMLKAGACPRIESLDLSESTVTDGRLLRLFKSLQECRAVTAASGGGNRGPSLCELRLDNNPIGNAGAATLSALLREHLSSLRHLHVTRLRLTSSGVKCLLKSLTASPGPKNRLETLAFSTCLVSSNSELAPLFTCLRLEGFAHLVRLDLTYLPLRDNGARELSLSLQHKPCPSLESLVLARTQIGRAGLESFASTLGSTLWGQRLILLNLSGNLFGHELGMLALANAMRRRGLCNLKDLYIGESGLNPAACTYLFRALYEKACPQLRALDVNGNLVGDIGAFQLLWAVLQTPQAVGRHGLAIPPPPVGPEGISPLEVLNLAHCCLQTTAIVALGSTLQAGYLPRLRVLHVGDETSFSSGLCALTEALRQGASPLLEELSLSALKEGDSAQCIAAAVALAEAIEGPLCHSLRILRLCRIFMGHGMVVNAMAAAIRKTRRLEVLHIEAAQLGALGVQAIAGALSENSCPRLTSLCLSSNDAGDQGMIALASALRPRRMPSSSSLSSYDRAPHRPLACLQTLRLARNRIGRTGIRALAAALRAGACRRLVALDLDENPLGDGGVAILMASLLPAPTTPTTRGAVRAANKRLRSGPGAAPTGAGDVDSNKADEDNRDHHHHMDGFLPARLSGVLRSAGQGFRRLLGWGALRHHAGEGGGRGL